MAEVEEKGQWGGEGGWKEVCVCVWGGDLDFSGHLVVKKNKKEGRKASKCAVQGGGGRGMHKVAMFWLGRSSSPPMPALCLA